MIKANKGWESEVRTSGFSFMKFILGKKIQMTQVFKESGEVVPVTLVKAGPCFISQIKKGAPLEGQSVQIGFEETRQLKKPQAGHLKGLPNLKYLREFVLDKEENFKLEPGGQITVEIFKPGERVEVTGISKGKGFQGVVKRHGFHGSPATHGHKDQLRMPGAIGAGGVQRVFKGMRMAGRMGGEQVTVKNLEIVAVEPESHLLKIKGALPGGRNSFLIIKAPGELILKEEPKAEQKADDKSELPNQPEPKPEEMIK